MPIVGRYRVLDQALRHRGVVMTSRFAEDRQANHDSGTVSNLALNANRPLVSEYDALTQRQAQTYSRSCRLGSKKWIKHPFEIVRLDPAAIVDYSHQNAPITLLGARIFGDHTNYTAAILDRIGGVEEQI